MSLQEQDHLIIAAQKKRRIGVFVLSSLVMTALIIYLLWLFVAQGFQIAVIPENVANIAQVSVKQGTGLVLDNKVYLFGSTATLQVSAPKYLTAEVALTKQSPAIVQVQLTPAPVSVVVTSVPSLQDTLWQVNGQTVSQSSSLTWQGQPGSILVEARHPWFEPSKLNLKGEPADIILEEINLIPLKGQLVIQSNPSGAEIKVNGKSVGETPVTFPEYGGEHTIEVALSGYQMIEDLVEINGDTPAPLRNYQLQPEQGQLSIELTPGGGVLLANNQPVAATMRLDANETHEIRYEKAGYKGFKTKVFLKPSEQQTLAITLEPEFGKVRLTANVPAQVESNGTLVGSTPLTLSLQTFRQELRFIKPGFRTVVQSVNPKLNSTVALHAEMLSEFDARRAEGKPLFISGLGIEVKRFTPAAFTMGSPDNEPYRRRNEHRISVDFSRAIWVSKHEITEAQYAAYTGDSANSSDMPVTDVSWLEAAAYCHWLSIQEGLPPFYLFENGQLKGIDKQARGYRLLTEAEWEWLAKVAHRRVPTTFSWGSQESLPKDYGNYADESVAAEGKFTFAKYHDGVEQKASVGSFKADRTGLYDLDGNVSEWVHDRFTLLPPKTGTIQRNYLGMERGTGHVIKGGNYESGRFRDLRVAKRDEGTEPSNTVGFRIARYH